jgi:hypothetical protein
VQVALLFLFGFTYDRQILYGMKMDTATFMAKVFRTKQTTFFFSVVKLAFYRKAADLQPEC